MRELSLARAKYSFWRWPTYRMWRCYCCRRAVGVPTGIIQGAATAALTAGVGMIPAAAIGAVTGAVAGAAGGAVMCTMTPTP